MLDRKILIDTSVLIQGQRDKVFLQTLEKYQDRLYISRVTAMELIFGSQNSLQKKANLELFTFLPLLEITEPISKLAFKLLDKYCLTTHLLIPDALIGATSIVNRCELWTEDTKHLANLKEVLLFQP